ncbi:MAG: DUF899 family protein [Myxococcota bacterium]
MTPDVQARLGALYREIEAARHELVSLIKEHTAGPVDDMALAGPSGPVPLSALFGERDELLLVFNMGAHCAYCTLWADEANGVLRHLRQAAAFAVTSPDPPEVQAAFAASRGWAFPMVSHAGTDFAASQGFAAETEDGPGWMPGVASYRRTPEGIVRVATMYFGPGDPYCSVFHYLELLGSEGAGYAPTL